jgi:hypothetical protein
MSIIKLTQDLENFKWTNYNNAGNNNSSITRTHQRTQFDTPQAFYDGHSQVVTGQKEFDRPNEGALSSMESRFGTLNTRPPERGPYSVADYMYGRQTGRGFAAPGQAPLGFTVDMQSLTGGVKSQIEIDGNIAFTPLSYVVAGVNSSLDYGVVPEKTIDITPDAYGAYGVNVLPISSYTSRILSRDELEDYTSAPVGGRGVSYYGRLESLYNKDSMFQKEDGTYTTPIGQSTIPGSQTEFQNFMEFGGRGIQRTFEISREYPNNTTAYTIDTQFGTTFENKLLESHGSAVTPDIPLDKYDSLPAMIKMGKMESLFYVNYGDSNGVWPYQTLGFTGTHPLIKKEIGDRIPTGGQDWMALQVLKTGDDINRINLWLETSAGQLWQDKQHILQQLNPREETRDWSKSNLVLSVPPLFHATRHFGGETYMEKADFGPIIEGDPPQGTSIGSLFSGTKFGKWVGKVSKKVGDKMEAADTAIGGAAAGLDSFFGGIDFNKEGGRLRFLTNKMIKQIPDDGGFGGMMTNMRSAHSPAGRPPKVPTQVVFSQKGAYGKGLAHKSDVNVHPLKRYQMALGGYGAIGIRDLPYHSPIASPFVKDAIVENKQAGLNWEMAQRSAKVRASGGRTDEDKKYQGLVAKWVANHGDIEAEAKSIEEQQKAFDSYVKSVGKSGEIADLIGDPGRLQNALKIFADDKETGTGLENIKKDVGSESGKGYKSMATDKVNIHPYGKDLPKEVNDFIKFKFYDVTNKKFIIFRAILSGVSDSISPEWSGTQYIGRPDKVYVYRGAERKISFNFEIYPKTKQEFPVLLEKMNYLVGLCYPSFTSGNRMVAPFINLTIGDMFVETPGFLDSLSVEVDDSSTWELDEGLQFPKHITCNCSFTYIGKYLPSSLGKHYELPWLEDYGWKGGTDGQSATYGTFQAAGEKDTTTGKYPMKDQPERTRNMNKLMNPEIPNAK